MNKKVLIIIFFVVLISGIYFGAINNDTSIFLKNRGKVINKQPISVKVINDFEKIRIDSLNYALENKDKALCDNNETCSTLYSYRLKDYDLKVIPVEDYLQIVMKLKQDGSYKNVHLSGDDCIHYNDIYCSEDTIMFNFKVD